MDKIIKIASLIIGGIGMLTIITGITVIFENVKMGILITLVGLIELIVGEYINGMFT